MDGRGVVKGRGAEGEKILGLYVSGTVGALLCSDRAYLCSFRHTFTENLNLEVAKIGV